MEKVVEIKEKVIFAGNTKIYMKTGWRKCHAGWQPVVKYEIYRILPNDNDELLEKDEDWVCDSTWVE